MKKTLVGLNILIVEDDQVLLELMCDYFEGTGATIFQASNGELAFQIVEKERIDLVLSDVQMPVMGGIELVKKIRSNNSVLPLVLLVTGQCEFNLEEALRIGASDLIQKPFKLSEVVERVNRLFAAATAKAS